MTIIGISGRCCCVRAITGHAAALPSPAMNSRRRIGHASHALSIAYRSWGCMSGLEAEVCRSFLQRGRPVLARCRCQGRRPQRPQLEQVPPP